MSTNFQLPFTVLPAPVHSHCLWEPAQLQSTHVLYVLVFRFVGDVVNVIQFDVTSATFQFNWASPNSNFVLTVDVNDIGGVCNGINGISNDEHVTRWWNPNHISVICPTTELCCAHTTMSNNCMCVYWAHQNSNHHVQHCCHNLGMFPRHWAVSSSMTPTRQCRMHDHATCMHATSTHGLFDMWFYHTHIYCTVPPQPLGCVVVSQRHAACWLNACLYVQIVQVCQFGVGHCQCCSRWASRIYQYFDCQCRSSMPICQWTLHTHTHTNKSHWPAWMLSTYVQIANANVLSAIIF